MKRWRLLSVLALIFLLGASMAQTQSGGDFALTWHTIDGGGATSGIGGAYTLGATIGQPDAGVMSGGTFDLAGGFWHGGGTTVSGDQAIYLPLVQRNG